MSMDSSKVASSSTKSKVSFFLPYSNDSPPALPSTTPQPAPRPVSPPYRPPLSPSLGPVSGSGSGSEASLTLSGLSSEPLKLPKFRLHAHSMDPLSEFRQVEQYIARFDKALREYTPFAAYEELQRQRQGEAYREQGPTTQYEGGDSGGGGGSSSCGGQEHMQSETYAGRHLNEGVTWCRLSGVFEEEEEAIAIPHPPPSLRLLEYRCKFDGLQMAEALVARRQELWHMVQEQQEREEQREFEELMVRLKLEQKKDRALQIAKLDHRQWHE
ncbi:hypothetical protein BG004_005624 [Podila humilis]|nr:hypothetical protein BG004_005624 [Podila humilis]